MKVAQALDDPFQGRAFLVQPLRFFGIVPGIWLGKGQLDFGQALFLLGEVKGTP